MLVNAGSRSYGCCSEPDAPEREAGADLLHGPVGVLNGASNTEAKGFFQGSRLPSERPRIFPDWSEKVPLSQGNINIAPKRRRRQPLNRSGTRSMVLLK
jgi:hypothetical protein